MSVLQESARTLLKATHTPIELPLESRDRLGRFAEKRAFLQSIAPSDEEVPALQEALRRSPELEHVAQLLPQWTDGWQPLADPTVLANVPVEHLVSVGEALVELRETARKDADGSTARRARHAGQKHPLRERETEAGPSLDLHAPVSVADLEAALRRRHVADTAEAVKTFARQVRVSPIGLLHLERVEMAPAGLQRGELLGTVALAPGERTAVETVEWSVTEQDLATIVTDSLEDYTEKGVTEKSELAQATTTETTRTQQLGLSASVSGTYGFVTFAASTQFSSALQSHESQQSSRNQAREVTAKAASRVRKERKVTVQTRTVTGSSTSTSREIVNTSATAGMRVDYFSIMRRWRVRLFQYGVRQTYDIAVPAPGVSLRSAFLRIDEIDTQLEAGFSFGLKVSDIERATYRDLEHTYNVSLPPPPDGSNSVTVGGQMPGLDKGSGWKFHTIEFEVPDNYEVESLLFRGMIGNVGNDDPGPRDFVIFGSGRLPDIHVNGKGSFEHDLSSIYAGVRGRQEIRVFAHHVDVAMLTFVVRYVPTESAMARWRFSVWERLRQTAAEAFAGRQAALAAEREQLLASMTALDTLTLRREEREEIMRQVLRWLLGPSFEFMSSDLVDLLKNQAGVGANRLAATTSQWGAMFRYQEMVKFLHQAIEWENLLYFVYPYFWDRPDQWDLVRRISHPDPTRQQFLRAGSARIVLTVRPGFEQAFAEFVDQGSFGSVLPPNHPYVTIGEEIAAYGRVNYAGIPPANPTQSYRSLLTPESRQAWAQMGAICVALDEWSRTNGAYPSTADGLAVLPGPVPTRDPWGNDWVYRSPGRFTEFELLSCGPDGVEGAGPDGEDDDITSWAAASLISEWFEYTPSRGIDIDVNSVLATLA